MEIKFNSKIKLIVIGGGPAGLAAALEANRNGVAAEDILIIERDRELGGILNQCIHAGFGLHIFGEELTGPEYAERFIKQVEESKIPYITDSMVLSINESRSVSFVSPQTGFMRVNAGAIVIACGCRERPKGALNIAGSRPSGIFTAGSAQRFVNIENCKIGNKIVILGSGDIGLIMARRLTLEGAEVLRVCELMPYSGGLARNIAQCLDDFGIPLYLSHTVTHIHGKDRVEGVTISQVEKETLRPIKGTEEYVECDTLLLSVGLIPENELTRDAGIKMDRITGGAVVNQHCETSVEGIFACGNALQVHDLVDFVTMEAYSAGKAAADYINNGTRKSSSVCIIEAGNGVRYVVPQNMNIESESVSLYMRVSNIYRNVKLIVKIDGEVIRKISKNIVTPGEMEKIELKAGLINPDCKIIQISVEE